MDENGPGHAAVRQLFGRIAATYDVNNRLHTCGIDRLWRKTAVRLARVGAGDRVLDLACGTGEVALALRRETAAAEVWGADCCREMLARAQGKRGAEHIRWLQCDALRLPFPSMSFDVVVIAFGLRNFSCRGTGLGEALRVLRHGGRLLVLEFCGGAAAGRWPLRGLLRLYTRQLMPVTAGLCSGDRPAYTYLRDSVAAFPEPVAIAEEIFHVGFRGVRTRHDLLHLVAYHLATRPEIDAAR